MEEGNRRVRREEARPRVGLSGFITSRIWVLCRSREFFKRYKLEGYVERTRSLIARIQKSFALSSKVPLTSSTA